MVKKQILTVKKIRNINMENSLQSLVRQKHMTRNMLAKENSISLMTVKHVVDRLIEAGILVEKETINAEVGRKPKMVELSPKYGKIACLNLTSNDEISYIIYDIYENLLGKSSIAMDMEYTYLENLMLTIDKIKEKLKEEPTELVGVAVFVPSAYDEETDQVNYDLISGLKDLRIKALFADAFSLDNVLVLHDVVAAAKSEYDRLGSDRESQFYFYCGYGVGGCFIHKGEVITGEQHMAGEVGKMLFPVGQIGEGNVTVENLVSISAVKKRMKQESMDMEFEDLLMRYEEGEQIARMLMEPVVDTICNVLYNLLWVYNPASIVVDSCKSAYSRIIIQKFQAFMDMMVNDAIPIHTEIKQAKYDEYHMMRGCFKLTRSAWIESIADLYQ